MTNERDERLQEIGKTTHSVLADMVAALRVDYQRLEELRDERDSYEPEDDQDADWANEYPDEASELAELESDAGDCESEDDAGQRIDEDPLSVQVRSGWHSPGAETEPEEYEILLSTGGPATRIVGELDEHCQPSSARLEAQDWFTPWTEYADSDEEMLLAYASRFYFGD